jgi:hypothetical protein
MDGGIVVGYLNTSNNQMIGIQLVEPNPGPELRARMFAGNDGIGGAPVSGIELNTQYDFNLTYNPGTFELSGNIGPLVFGPTATGLSDGATFDAFAMLSGTAGSNDSSRTATVYFDDLNYNAVPEPASIVLLGSALLAILAVARRRAK